jgi:DNA-binding protein H-NS
MAQTYDQIRKKIETLQREAETLRRKEAQGVVARIKEAIAAYGLTAQDLGFGGGASPAPKKTRKPRGGAAKPAKKAASKVAVKYRDADGNTWTGRGLKPRWLRAAIESGKKLEDFKI